VGNGGERAGGHDGDSSGHAGDGSGHTGDGCPRRRLAGGHGGHGRALLETAATAAGTARGQRVDEAPTQGKSGDSLFYF
jgi:hypothetical protein